MKMKLVSAMLLSMALPSHAFKINTHAFIGQSVINDLSDDGKVTIPYNDTNISISVSDDVKKSILSNKNFYLMGTMGPDVTPDVVVGQNVVHPGSEGVSGRWEVTGWLNYLSNEMNNNGYEKSFYYGYLSHVASDVFAHTYVNQYSGDVFSLFDDETLVERRHIALEGYIDAKTPSFTDENNQIIADTAASIINLDDKYGALIRDKLIYNDEVYNQYKKSSSAVHLVGYKAFRDEVDALANNNIWHEIDKLVVRFIAEYYYNVDLSDEEAGKLLEGFQPINEVLNGKIPDYLQSFDNKIHKNLKKWEALGFNSLVSKINDAQELEKKLRDKKHQLDNKINKFESDIRHKGCDFAENALNTLDPTGITTTLLDSKFVISSIKDPIKATQSLLTNAKKSWPVKKVCKVVKERVKIPGGSCPLWGLLGCAPDPVWKIVEKTVCNIDHDPRPYINISASFNKTQYNNNSFKISKNVRDVNGNSVNQAWDKALKMSAAFLPQDDFIPVSVGDIYVPIIKDPDDVININMTMDKLSIYRADNYAQLNRGNKTLIYEYNTKSKRVNSKDVAFCRTINNSIDHVNNSSVRLIHKLENEFASINNQLVQKNIDIRNETVKAIDELHNIQNLIVDLNQMLIQRASPIQSLLIGWRDELDEAMLQYTLAASQSMLNTTNKDIEIPYQPMIDWFNNYHLAIISGSKVNGIASSASQIIDSLNKIKKLSAIDPLGDLIDKEIKKLEDKAKNLAKRRLVSEFNKFLPDNMKDLIAILSKNDFSDYELNQVFTTPETEENYKGLIMISDMAKRIRTEMNMIDDKYDPNSYFVVKNAITLSKLALLDNQGLKELALTIGLDAESVGNLDNIVKGAFNNIDANHQWMHTAPPLPRDAGFATVNNGKTYANEGKSYGSDKGFFLWGNAGNNSNDEFRKNVFMAIFKGPLSSGIDAPEIHGLNKLVTDEYEMIYNPTREITYPNLKID